MSDVFAQPDSAIEPFWRRLRQISLYPMQVAALGTIALLAGLRLLGLLPIAGIWINVLLWVAVYKYAADVLVRTANGRMEAPEGYANHEDDVGWDLLKVQVLLGLISAAAMQWLGPVFGWTVAIVIALASPGATMSVAVDRSVLHAMNPLVWLQFMTRLGWPYFFVAGLCLVFSISQVNAQALLLPFLPAWLGIVVFYLIAHYALVATFHLMGYLIYQYHDVLGYEIERREVLRRPGDPNQELLDEAEAFVRAGDDAAAESLLREHVMGRGAAPVVHDRYRKLLALRSDSAQLLAHGREYLNVLLALEQPGKALDLARECLVLDKSFQPMHAEQVHQLAAYAVAHNAPQLALNIVSGFHRAFPKHRDIPKNYLLAAKLLAEQFNQEPQARAMLQQVRRAFPTHALLPEIDAYLAYLDAAAPGARPLPATTG